MLQSTLTVIVVALFGGSLAGRNPTPLYCNYGVNYPPATYENDRSTYTARTDTECCYLEDTRNICCMDFKYVSNAWQSSCKCSPTVTCGLLPDTTTTMTPPTTPPTTATTTTITTTTTTTTTETPTTTTEPTTTTTEETTTTTMMTTTETFVSLCGVKSRVMNGQPADYCANLGMANITLLYFDKEFSFCNAVLTLATVEGRAKVTFLTTHFCTEAVKELSSDVEIHLNIGTQTYPFMPSLMSIVESTDGAAFIDINDRYRNILSDLGCQQPICAYDADTMTLDFNDCRIVSYGVFNFDQDPPGLYQVPIKEDVGGCSDVTEEYGASNTRCFTTVSGENVDSCEGDSGAMVTCRATENGEWILVGVKSKNDGCDSTPNLRVINYPG